MKEIQLPFNTQEFRMAWLEWLEYRKERKLPKYVSIGLKKTFAALVRDSNNDEMTAMKIIEQSISNNWQGLFPLKTNNQFSNGTKDRRGAKENSSSFIP
jgi:hypothetical protein